MQWISGSAICVDVEATTDAVLQNDCRDDGTL